MENAKLQESLQEYLTDATECQYLALSLLCSNSYGIIENFYFLLIFSIFF